jgi:hypothetical protein
MSSAHDDAHAFDGEPARALPEDEPRTPGWIPALGFALFFASAAYFIATSEGAPAPSGEAPATTTSAASAAPSASASARADAKALSSVMQRSPEQVKELQRRIEELRKKRAADAPGGSASAAPKPVQVEKP